MWKKLKKSICADEQHADRPILVLAPMANVTDPAFRQIIAKYGKPPVIWTEFVSADGLFLGGEHAQKLLLRDLSYTEAERPIVAQVFTSNPERMRKAAALCRKLGFDGFDINMGCPDRSVEKQGAGAALMKNPKLAQELILAAKDGAGDMPVSVKTRIGYNKNEIETWLPALLETKPAVVTIHARTRKEMSKVPARWDVVKRAVEIRNDFGSETYIFGNGDVMDLTDARLKAKESGADGVMLGRAIFGNPWLFAEQVPTLEKKLKVLIEHTNLHEKFFGKTKSFAFMKKHFKAYVTGFAGAGELRAKLMEANNAREVEEILKQYLAKLPA